MRRERQQRCVRGLVTCSPQRSAASAVGSQRSTPWARIQEMQSVIHSTCCSIATGMLVSTEGLPGPVTVKRFGKPGTCSPR